MIQVQSTVYLQIFKDKQTENCKYDKGRVEEASGTSTRLRSVQLRLKR